MKATYIHRDTLSGFSSIFASEQPAAQNATLDALVKLCCTKPPLEQQQADSPREDAINITQTRSEAHPHTETETRETEISSSTTASSSSSEVGLLASLCPCPCPEDFLADLLFKKCNGELQSAANRILEASPASFQTEIAAWETKQNQSHRTVNTTDRASLVETLKPDEELRRSIIARFHLEAVPQNADGTRCVITAWGSSQQQQKQQQGSSTGAGKMRYRDGVLVSTKGEKFLIEKPAPEWDGGSKGRVKSKRKGGVGWH